jgi:hypothetical protein
VGDDENPLPDVEMRDSCNGAQDTFPKHAIALTTGPREVVVRLRFILHPDCGISLLHIMNREPIDRSTIDLGQRLYYLCRAADVLRRGICRFESSSEWANAYRVEARFSDEPAAQQIDLPVALFGQRDIMAAT